MGERGSILVRLIEESSRAITRRAPWVSSNKTASQGRVTSPDQLLRALPASICCGEPMNKRNDPYFGFRDDKGRFIKGHPGRTTYSWLSKKEFKKKYKFLNIKKPDACPNCGQIKYRFNVRFDNKNTWIVRCKCNACNHPRTYKSYSETWSSI